jgi:GNAT superfamily N-acetyltransferase
MVIRPARAEDRPFVLATVERLAAFSPPPWRTGAEIVDGEARTLRAFFDAPDPAWQLLIAEFPAPRSTRSAVAARPTPERIGFAFLEELRDYFTLEPHGHIGILAVTEAAEGRGAAAALIRAAETWSRDRGYLVLTLNVFERNRHARAVYEHVGFESETIKYVKRL